jgi:hypothetical protein
MRAVAASTRVFVLETLPGPGNVGGCAATLGLGLESLLFRYRHDRIEGFLFDVSFWMPAFVFTTHDVSLFQVWQGMNPDSGRARIPRTDVYMRADSTALW